MQANTDPSVTAGLAEATNSVLPALDEFLGFEARDLAALEYGQWQAALLQPLPEKGTGVEATLQALRTIVIPHGSRIGAPGFSGWVNAMPTVVPTVAAFSMYSWRAARLVAVVQLS